MLSPGFSLLQSLLVRGFLLTLFRRRVAGEGAPLVSSGSASLPGWVSRLLSNLQTLRRDDTYGPHPPLEPKEGKEGPPAS